MHTLFGITLVLYLLKLSAGKGYIHTLFDFLAKTDITPYAAKQLKIAFRFKAFLKLYKVDIENLFVFG